jgi:hypothetical protein
MFITKYFGKGGQVCAKHFALPPILCISSPTVAYTFQISIAVASNAEQK